MHSADDVSTYSIGHSLCVRRVLYAGAKLKGERSAVAQASRGARAARIFGGARGRGCWGG
eukprot:4759538-Lingulodinium_polyedra.AAC.1